MSWQREQRRNRRKGRCTTETGERGEEGCHPAAGPGGWGGMVKGSLGREPEVGSGAILVTIETAPGSKETWGKGCAGEAEFMTK